jgi:hypothetical protein
VIEDPFKPGIIEAAIKLTPDGADRQGMLTIPQIAEELLPHIENDEIRWGIPSPLSCGPSCSPSLEPMCRPAPDRT